MSQVAIEMVAMECGACGIAFMVPAHFNNECRENKKTWYCPSGHPRVYRKSRAQELEEQLAQEKQKTERERQAAIEARVDAQGARLKADRLEKKLGRIRRGVCTECNRTFQNIARHMTSKHPGCVARSR